MLNEWSDRGPEPPHWKTVMFWGAVGAVGALLIGNVVRGVLTGAWKW